MRSSRNSPLSNEGMSSCFDSDAGVRAFPSIQSNSYNSNPSGLSIPAQNFQVQINQHKNCSKLPKNIILIFVCQPGFKGRKVSVNPTDPLFIVNVVFPGQKKVYFFYGKILNPVLTFHDCYITNGARIVTVPIEQMSINAEAFWKKATQNCSKDKNKLSVNNDQVSKRLVARNKDLVLLQEEIRPNSSFLANSQSFDQDKSSSSVNTVIPEESKCISEEPLPLFGEKSFSHDWSHGFSFVP
jgi:hypothetical protein